MDEIPATWKKDFPSKHETPYYRHFRLHWFRWMIEQAPDFGLVRIAGDLLDMFKFETRLEQAREIRSLIRLLADVVPRFATKPECRGSYDHLLLKLNKE
jgi:hypothetical protein